METRDVRKLYGEARNRLCDVVLSRNQLLRRLEMMARPAMELTPP